MADQVGSGMVHDATGGQAGLAPQSTDVAHAEVPGSWRHEPFHGRPVSWVAVVVIIIGFLVGGIGLCAGPSWAAFWVGAGVTVLGCIVAASIGIFNDWY